MKQTLNNNLSSVVANQRRICMCTELPLGAEEQRSGGCVECKKFKSSGPQWSTTSCMLYQLITTRAQGCVKTESPLSAFSPQMNQNEEKVKFHTSGLWPMLYLVHIKFR